MSYRKRYENSIVKNRRFIFGEAEKILSSLKKPRNRYINEAIDHYNKLQKRLLLEKKLLQESDLVKKDSMSVLKDFERIDYGN